MSQASPNCRASQPIPPPRVRPPTPVCETLPAVVARPYSLRRAVQFAQQRAALDPGEPLVGIDADRVHRRQVDHQPAVGNGVPGDVVTAAADPDLQVAAAAEPDRGSDVGGARGTGRCGRAPVDHRVPDRPASSYPVSPGAAVVQWSEVLVVIVVLLVASGGATPP